MHCFGVRKCFCMRFWIPRWKKTVVEANACVCVHNACCCSNVSDIFLQIVLPFRFWVDQTLIFSFRSQLPEEAKKFDNIDKLFKKIMQETVKNPKIKDCCHTANRLQDLQNLSDGLERCQKSLNDYLDSKRNAFPRYQNHNIGELLYPRTINWCSLGPAQDMLYHEIYAVEFIYFVNIFWSLLCCFHQVFLHIWWRIVEYSWVKRS